MATRTRERVDGAGADAAAPSYPSTVAAIVGDGAPMGLVPLERIRPNPDNPRTRFDEAGLEELAESIRANGLIEPLVVQLDGGAPIDPRRVERGWVNVLGEERGRKVLAQHIGEAAATPRGELLLWAPYTSAEWTNLRECYRDQARRMGLEARLGDLEYDAQRSTRARLAVWNAHEPRYLPIAGERRWRAARLAGLAEVPAIVRRGLDAAGALRLALAENLVRAELDAGDAEPAMEA